MTGAHLIEIVEDAAVSGSRMLVDRAGGRQIAALLEARRPEADAVVIVRLDRLGRNAAETLAYLRRFASGSVGLVSIVDRVDLSSPQGRAMAQLGAVFAELEKALIGQRTSEALSVLRSEGRVYGPTPFGMEVLCCRSTPTCRLQPAACTPTSTTSCVLAPAATPYRCSPDPPGTGRLLERPSS